MFLSVNLDRTYAKQPYLVGANGRSPLQMVYNWVFCVSPRKMIKKTGSGCLLLISLSFFSLILGIDSVRADNDRDATTEEIARIKQVLAVQGCSLDDDHDVEFYFNRNRYEVDDVICSDGKIYEIYLDQNFNIISKRQDD